MVRIPAEEDPKIIQTTEVEVPHTNHEMGEVQCNLEGGSLERGIRTLKKQDLGVQKLV